jgi:subtilase family serine protease
MRIEELEPRLVPASVTPFARLAESGAVVPAGGPGLPAGYSPSQLRHAYGFDQITFNGGTVKGDGSGQTIAIIDAYDDPNIASDLTTFDATYGIAAPPSFTKVNQTGGTTYPAGDSSWALEISLDVEWAHAIAPGANLVLVEANTNNFSDLLTAVNYAKSLTGVSVISMSWGSGEYGTETGTDSYFVSPSGHTGITFIASTGDSGSSGAPQYPSVSSNVLAVGGTQLTLDSSGNYSSEIGWNGSGGGVSAYESQPSYQNGVVTQSSTRRTVPDVAYDASSSSAFAVYDTYLNSGWLAVYGTSAGAPQWSALIAIADQGRAAAGQGTLDGSSQTLPKLYQLPQSDFHDITSGSNGGYSAGPGYDLVTGRGSPFANLIVPALIDGSASSGNQPPYVVTLASATPSPVTGSTTNLSVQGGDDGGAANLTYLWTATSTPAGVKPPSFSANGNNAAQNSTATFYAAGSYTFRVTITDAGGLTTTSNVAVTVNQTLTSLRVSPGTATLVGGGTQQFQATTTDQFGNPMGTQPSFGWSVTGIGTISGTGMYTAPGTTGTATVQAAGGGLTGTASVTVSAVPAAPTNLTAAAANNHQVNLSWQESLTIQTGFIIQRSTNNHNWAQIATVGATATTYQDTTVAGNKTYYYRVCAYNAAGNSGWSNLVTVVTPHVGVLSGTGDRAPSLTLALFAPAGSAGSQATDLGSALQGWQFGTGQQTEDRAGITEADAPAELAAAVQLDTLTQQIRSDVARHKLPSAPDSIDILVWAEFDPPWAEVV